MEKKTDSLKIPHWIYQKKHYHPTPVRKMDLLHTKLEVEFDWEKRYLYGRALLRLKPFFYEQDSLILDAKGFDISSIKGFVKGDASPWMYRYDEKQISIALPRRLSRVDTFTVIIDYVAKPDELPEGGSEAITSDKGLYFINPDGKDPTKPRQIWTQGQTDGNSCWFPTIDDPNERSTQEMYITVDKNFKTISNGELIYSRENADKTRTDYWKMDLPHAPYLFMMAIGEYTVVKDKWQDKEVSYYVEREYQAYAKKIFGDTPEMIEFFSNKLDYPFPWNKYVQVVVRDYVSGAMENTTASIFMEYVQVDDRELLDQNWESIIAHELFHQWFGDLVTCESWGQLTLNEAFANYSEYLWAEHKYGREEADYVASLALDTYLEEAQIKQVPLIRDYYEDPEDMFDAHSYEKGGLVLHMLRYYLGDEAFWASLSSYLKKNAFSSVEVQDLRLAFEEVSGKDLSWFFDQWFLEAGHPQIQVNHRYQNGVLTLATQQVQDTTYLPVFRLPLKVRIWQGDQYEDHPIAITKAQQEFRFMLPQPPSLVLFDADQQLLAEVFHEKTLEELRFQFYHEKTYSSRYEALSKLQNLGQEKVYQMYADALEDPSWHIRETAVEGFINYEGEHEISILQKVNTMAREDEKSSVRAKAMSLLGDSRKKYLFKNTFRKGIEDPSYEVLSASLYALWVSQEGEEDIDSIYRQFEGLDAPDVINTLADYYVATGTPDKFDWFSGKVQRFKGFARYPLVLNFGRYLEVGSPEQKQEGLRLLSE
ncbi:MAG: M1 family metallopeptidase, partial [Bacteroidota bacterium]